MRECSSKTNHSGARWRWTIDDRRQTTACVVSSIVRRLPSVVLRQPLVAAMLRYEGSYRDEPSSLVSLSTAMRGGQTPHLIGTAQRKWLVHLGMHLAPSRVSCRAPWQPFRREGSRQDSQGENLPR